MKGWLRDLEERVQEASTRLRELRAENEQLREKLGELEQRLAAEPGEGDAAGWAEEREEIRRRVEDLVQHLDELLAE
jgi:predicted  nucleic acid-binding Zn-ribbon protein